jgi:hypothetical protein
MFVPNLTGYNKRNKGPEMFPLGCFGVAHYHHVHMLLVINIIFFIIIGVIPGNMSPNEYDTKAWGQKDEPPTSE